MESSRLFSTVVLNLIQRTHVPPLLVAQSARAVVLERIARGAGATRWYLVSREVDLVTLSERLSPGSWVSFYFDDRLAIRPYDQHVASTVLEFASRDGDAVIGMIPNDGIEILVELVANREELNEYAQTLGDGCRVMFGPFPAADDDGLAAVSVSLPDRDGVQRSHPH